VVSAAHVQRCNQQEKGRSTQPLAEATIGSSFPSIGQLSPRPPELAAAPSPLWRGEVQALGDLPARE